MAKKRSKALVGVGLFILGVGAGAAVPASLLVATGPAQSADGPSVAARLQQLEDREAIRTLIIDYGRTLDARDWKGFANLFAEDGEWVGGMGSAKGHAAIQKMMEDTIGPSTTTSPAGISGPNLHVFTNVTIKVDGDAATGLTKWMFMTMVDNHPQPYYLGHYEDSFVRENGVWKFAKRTAFGDIPPAAPKTSN